MDLWSSYVTHTWGVPVSILFSFGSSVADPDPFDTDPDPAFHFHTDPDPYRFK